MIWFSADGIHFGEGINIGSLDKGDTNQGIWWDTKLKKYVLITRHWGGETTDGRYGHMGHRQKSRSESSDFIHWSKPEVVIEGVDLRMQIHDMPVVPHAGVYLGMVGLFDINASRQWCELAWSPDTVTWHRVDPGSPLIVNSPNKGGYDWGCVYTAAYPVFLRDQIRLYYGGSDDKHFGWRKGAFCLARLRPDGFAGGRSPLQCGAELYGSDNVESDIEVIRLMLATLEKTGINGAHLDLAHVGIFRGLVQQAGLNEQQEGQLFDALQRKAVPEINGLLDEWALDAPESTMLRALVDLNGGSEVLDEAAKVFASAGDTVYLRGGTYDGQEIRPTNSGTSPNDRIVYSNHGSESVLIRDSAYGIYLYKQSYVTVHGIAFESMRRFMRIYASHFIEVSHCRFDGRSPQSGDWVGALIADDPYDDTRASENSTHNWVHHCTFYRWAYGAYDDGVEEAAKARDEAIEGAMNAREEAAQRA